MLERFRRSFEKRKSSEEKSEQHAELPRSLGSTSLQSVERPIPQVEVYRVQAKEIVDKAEQAFVEFAQAAAEKGLDIETIKQAIFAGVEAGKLPRIAQPEMRIKDGSKTVFVLHGDSIPEEVVAVALRTNTEGRISSAGLEIKTGQEFKFIPDIDDDTKPESEFSLEPVILSSAGSGFRDPYEEDNLRRAINTLRGALPPTE